jgi:Co/Zn/Cd efflux system component
MAVNKKKKAKMTLKQKANPNRAEKIRQKFRQEKSLKRIQDSQAPTLTEEEYVAKQKAYLKKLEAKRRDKKKSKRG